jgi:opacity protein-like surface antigen
MRLARILTTAGATALCATASLAADLGPIIPPMFPPPVQESFGNWYLRGDVGMTNQTVGELDNVLFRRRTNLVIHDKNFESGMLFGLGAGYQWNGWLRTDLTGEYRGETGFHGFDTWTGSGGLPRFNNYTAKKSEWLVLANAYLDLGTWWHLTPFVGAGVGAARVTIHSFREAGIDPLGVPTMAFADTASTWNFAWAIHAGLAYHVTRNFTVELAYRYVHLGDGKSGDIIAFDGTNSVNNPMEFKDLSSHDLKLGIRWAFEPPLPAYSAPISPHG